MRIIGGEHGGRKFNPPAEMPHTRPTTDIAKEGLFNVLQTLTLTFPEDAIVSDTKAPNAHLFSDALEWFKNPAVIDFATYSNVTTEGRKAQVISFNYTDMFRVDHIDN